MPHETPCCATSAPDGATADPSTTTRASQNTTGESKTRGSPLPSCLRAGRITAVMGRRELYWVPGDSCSGGAVVEPLYLAAPSFAIQMPELMSLK